jgi:chemotaxis response regulator CheB
VDVMPRAAITQVPEALVVPLDQIAQHLRKLAQPAKVGGAAK